MDVSVGLAASVAVISAGVAGAASSFEKNVDAMSPSGFPLYSAVRPWYRR
ncbi:MAG: hypothetical protein HY836_07980 [Aquabacterium sp.]|nr:hypothetical protein [Aquabacterium sp.]